MAIFSTIVRELFTKFNAVIWAVAVLITTLTGPFLTFEMPLVERGLFWFCAISLAFLTAHSLKPFVRDMLLRGRNQWVQDCTCSFIFAVIYGGFLLYLIAAFAERVDNPTDAFTYVVLVAIALVCALCVAMVRHATLNWMIAPNVQHEVQPSRLPERPRPRLFRRLPDCAKGPILRLWVEDHFVNVVTPGQTYRVRMRFADAVAEMEGVDGYSTHRSHWIAREAIDAVERAGSKTIVRSKDGGTVPVSRSFSDRVEELKSSQTMG